MGFYSLSPEGESGLSEAIVPPLATCDFAVLDSTVFCSFCRLSRSRPAGAGRGL